MRTRGTKKTFVSCARAAARVTALATHRARWVHFARLEERSGSAHIEAGCASEEEGELRDDNHAVVEDH